MRVNYWVLNKCWTVLRIHQDSSTEIVNGLHSLWYDNDSSLTNSLLPLYIDIPIYLFEIFLLVLLSLWFVLSIYVVIYVSVLFPFYFSYYRCICVFISGLFSIKSSIPTYLVDFVPFAILSRLKYLYKLLMNTKLNQLRIGTHCVPGTLTHIYLALRNWNLVNS